MPYCVRLVELPTGLCPCWAKPHALYNNIVQCIYIDNVPLISGPTPIDISTIALANG